MSPINTENFIAPAPQQSSRPSGSNFYSEQFPVESFGEHLRQAFRPAASGERSQRRASDSTSEKQRAGRGDDPLAADSHASARTTSQDSRRDAEESRGNAPSSDNESMGSDIPENQTDGDHIRDIEADGPETPQSQVIPEGAELVQQLLADVTEQNPQANQISKQNAGQPLSNPDSGQSPQLVENASVDEAGLAVASNGADALRAAQLQTDVDAESGKAVDTPKEPAVQNTVENSQNTVENSQNTVENSQNTVDKSQNTVANSQNTVENSQNTEQTVDGAYVDATVDKPGNAEKGTRTDEFLQETATAASSGEEASMRDAGAQSQIVAADGTIQEKNRRGSDRMEANATSRNDAQGDAQAAAAPSAASGAAAQSEEFKSSQNTADKIVASEAADKDMGDSKATSIQPAQTEISLAPNRQSAQEARTAAVSGTAQSEEIDTVDRVRFVQRVARAFEGVGRDGGTLRIRLHPSELGALRLEVTIRDGVLTARMETDTQAAKNILLDNLPALRDRLALQDIKVQQFDVDYAGGNNDGSPQSAADQHQPNQRSAGRQTGLQTEADAETASEDTQAAPRARRLGEAAQLDFVA